MFIFFDDDLSTESKSILKSPFTSHDEIEDMF